MNWTPSAAQHLSDRLGDDRWLMPDYSRCAIMRVDGVNGIKVANGNGHTLAEYKAALVATGGMQALAAKRLGVTRAAVSKRVLGSEELKQIVEAQREEFLDEAEDALRRAVSDREPWAVCFTLKTIGKTRGYVERVENDMMSGGKPLEFTLSLKADGGDSNSSATD